MSQGVAPSSLIDNYHPHPLLCGDLHANQAEMLNKKRLHITAKPPPLRPSITSYTHEQRSVLQCFFFRSVFVFCFFFGALGCGGVKPGGFDRR